MKKSFSKQKQTMEVEEKEKRRESALRTELKETLCQYITDTLIHIDTVRGFCEISPKWLLGREMDSDMMMDIKKRADNINLSIGHISKSEKIAKATGEYVRSKVTQVTADKKRAALENELAAVLKDILGDLDKLDGFLDALEKLAVTSPYVFEKNQTLHLPEGTSLEMVQSVITKARFLCPLLLQFKRDAQVFFLPKLQNVEVLSYQLDKYIQTTRRICKTLEKSSLNAFHLKTVKEAVAALDMDASEEDVRRMIDKLNQLKDISSLNAFHLKTMKGAVADLDVDASEEDVRRMIDQVNQLSEIRENQHFRMVFLFMDESCHTFISEFSNRQPNMIQCLKDLEEVAVQLDKMNKGAKISSVAGSSVGAVGGVLSIIGLALIPVTAGVSLALTLTGVGLGVTSGINSAVTTITEIAVNVNQQKKASQAFQSFMSDVDGIQRCLEEVSNQLKIEIEEQDNGIDVAVGVTKVLSNVGAVGKGIDGIVDAASAMKLLKSEDLISTAGKVVAEESQAVRSVSRLASDVPDIGQAVAKGPLALTKSARAGFIALNALFLGMDVFFICKDSINLAKGTETEASQLIRARAVLWHSEMEAWQKMHESLNESLPKSEKNKAVIDTPFYPEKNEK